MGNACETDYTIKISVVIPALNEEKLLPLCLDSLRRQSFNQPYEVIVVDNNSDDRTADVACEMGAKVVFEAHRGITWARQRGLEAARGEIIACVDADSQVEPDWLERIWQTIGNNRRTVAASGKILYYKGKNWKGNLHRLTTAATLIGDRLWRLLCNKSGTLWGGNFAVRRNALIQAGGFNKNVEFYGEDTELSLRLRKVGKIKFDKKIIVHSSPRRFENNNVLKTTWIFVSTFIRLVATDGKLASERPMRMSRFEILFRKILYASTVLIILAGLVFFAYEPSSALYGKVCARGSGNQGKVIALSFDDGPNEPYTSQVLRILDQNDIKANFFLIGINVAAYPDTVKKIARQGHILCNHTYSHSYWLPFKRKSAILQDIRRNESLIFGLTGLRTRLFRPPHGLRTPWYLRDLRNLNYNVITWSDMTSDYNLSESPEKIALKIIHHARPGGIIDLHDGKNVFHGIDRSNMVRALPIIIEQLKNEGYKFVTLPELLRMDPYK